MASIPALSPHDMLNQIMNKMKMLSISTITKPDETKLEIFNPPDITEENVNKVKTTKEQNRILIANPNIDMSIVASPGAGKTTSIIMKIVFMTQNYNVQLFQICMVTYNKFLARDMAGKLKHYGINSKNLGWCGTLHALCYRDTNKYGTLTPWIDKFKNYPEVYPGFKYIIFDEYQDADKSISEVVEILSRGKYLTIVGDERQSIYQYRGADPNLLLNVREKYVKYSLSWSFRCNINICKLLSRLYPSYPPIKSKIKGPRPKLYRQISSCMYDVEIIKKVVEIVNESKLGSIAIISPNVHSDKTVKFLNDIHSNIIHTCGVYFECNLGYMRDFDIQNKDVNVNIITSIHGTKGKEYDTVIMLNVIDVDYSFEYPTSGDLCKLFVGLSRARYNLHVFENLYDDTVGSLPWITDNEDLFDHVPGWIFPAKNKNVIEDNRIRSRKCPDFVRSLSTDQREFFLNDYNDEELVGSEPGLKNNYSSPELFGILIEILLSIKLMGSVPKFTFEIYITSAQWNTILRNKSLSWLDHLLEMVYPFSVKYYFKGNIIYICDEDGTQLSSISNNNIVSSLIYDEYYKYLPIAVSYSSSLTNSIDEQNINIIWWIIRFLRLTHSSLIGFNKPNLTPDQVVQIISYINSCNLLSSLSIIKYHRNVTGTIRLNSEDPINVIGEIDFESNNALIEVKCYSNNRSLEEAWLQTIIYNLLFRNMISPDSSSIEDIPISSRYHYKDLWRQTYPELPGIPIEKIKNHDLCKDYKTLHEGYGEMMRAIYHQDDFYDDFYDDLPVIDGALPVLGEIL